MTTSIAHYSTYSTNFSHLGFTNLRSCPMAQSVADPGVYRSSMGIRWKLRVTSRSCAHKGLRPERASSNSRTAKCCGKGFGEKRVQDSNKNDGTPRSPMEDDHVFPTETSHLGMNALFSWVYHRLRSALGIGKPWI